MNTQFFDRIKDAPITDILQLGCIDKTAVALSEVTIFHERIYIVFGDVLLKLESVNQYSELKLQFVDQIKVDFDFELLDNTLLVTISVTELLLDDTLHNNAIAAIDVYQKEDSFEKKQLCAAIGFHLAGGQYLFFDPTFDFGINVGGRRKRELWQENYPNTETDKIPYNKIVLSE